MARKRILDNYGDAVVVDLDRFSNEVRLDTDTVTEHLFTPTQARDLAKALKKAAKRAEERRDG